MELLRVRYDEQARGERRKQASLAIESAAVTLKPWREVVTPHQDVASGRYQQAEFAADLQQASKGDGPAEYRDPVEFFRRTYLTESLKGMLAGAVQRLTGAGGDPVVRLQTNFGGGKTHSMLALYHLCSEDVAPNELPGRRRVDAGRRRLEAAEGEPRGPGGQPYLARQSGHQAGRYGGAHVVGRAGLPVGRRGGLCARRQGRRARHEHGRHPARAPRRARAVPDPDRRVGRHARQLHDQSDLPAGSFETQFTFAQALTESAKLAGNCLLVVSLPASDTSGSPHTQSDDIEVGGQRGREALARLRNVVGRIESSWRPASAEEGFEIVRRRLFEPFADQARFKDRDVVARAFADLYRGQQQEFPPECRDADYEQRITAAYPIHPEVFDRPVHRLVDAGDVSSAPAACCA